MPHLALATIVVADYDEAIRFYVDAVGFRLREDTDLGNGKRWVVVAPADDGSAGLLLARATTGDQRGHIGNQTGGRVAFFLHTTDFAADSRRLLDAGVRFVEGPRQEDWGTVGVFEDLYGNRWDLIQRVPDRPGG